MWKSKNVINNPVIIIFSLNLEDQAKPNKIYSLFRLALLYLIQHFVFHSTYYFNHISKELRIK